MKLRLGLQESMAIHEEYTNCTSTLKRVERSYTTKNRVTTCNFDPIVDIEEGPQGDACCEDSSAVVVLLASI